MAEWLEQIENEDLRASETLTKFKDVGSLAESYVNLEAKMGRAVSVPGPDAPEEDKEAFRQSLIKADPSLTVKPGNDEFWKWAGAPAEADGYVIPDGVEFDEATQGKARAMALAGNLTADQFERVTKHLNEERQALVEEAEAITAEKAQKMTRILGAAENASVQAATALIEEFAHADLPVEHLTPELVVLLANISTKFRQDPQGAHQPNDPTPQLTAEEAGLQANEILKKLTSGEVPYGSDEYKALNRKRMRLMEKAATAA